MDVKKLKNGAYVIKTGADELKLVQNLLGKLSENSILELGFTKEDDINLYNIYCQLTNNMGEDSI